MILDAGSPQFLDMVIWITKFVHVAAIALWASGMLSMPFLLVQRRRLAGDAVHRLHRLVRFLHVQLVSPAALAAVATGIVLIYLREIFFVWFTIKLYFVAGLAACHVVTGLSITSTFQSDGRFGPLAATALTGVVAVAVVGVLFFVLAKPIVSLDALAGEAAAPGWLEGTFIGPLVDAFISWTR